MPSRDAIITRARQDAAKAERPPSLVNGLDQWEEKGPDLEGVSSVYGPAASSVEYLDVSKESTVGRLTNTELQRFLDEAKRNTGVS